MNHKVWKKGMRGFQIWVLFHRVQVRGRIWHKILKNLTNGMQNSYDVTSDMAAHWSDFTGYCIISWNLNLVKPDSGLKIEIIFIWHRFWPKSCQNWSKNGKIAKFVRFWPIFLAKNEVKCCLISIFRTDLESPYPGASFWPQSLRKLKMLFLTPCSISKTSTILRGSLHLTDQAQILHTYSVLVLYGNF